MIKIGNVTFKLPETLQDQVDEVVEELGYQNKSEYFRTAVREKLEKDLFFTRKDGDITPLDEAKVDLDDERVEADE